MRSRPVARAVPPVLTCGRPTLASLAESKAACAEDEPDLPLPPGELAPGVARFDPLFLKSAITGRSGRASESGP